MQTKRLFTATFIDREIFRDIYGEIIGDFSQYLKGKWVEPGNLHFTYQFLGDVETDRIKNLANAMAPLTQVWRGELIIEGLGCFPGARDPRVFFADVKNPDGKLFNIKRQADEILAEYGFTPEKRKYLPHVTLLRIKEANPAEFSKVLDKYSKRRFGAMPEFRFCLVESSLTPAGPVYRIIS